MRKSSLPEWKTSRETSIELLTKAVSSWFPTKMFPLTGSVKELELFTKLMANSSKPAHLIALRRAVYLIVKSSENSTKRKG